jgi:hypothetical protein
MLVASRSRVGRTQTDANMDKITSFMRVTKKRRALQDKDAVVAAKGKANAKSTSSTTTTGGGGAAVAKAPVTEAEDAEFVPEFIFKVAQKRRFGTLTKE